jgi:hypothetical protein
LTGWIYISYGGNKKCTMRKLLGKCPFQRLRRRWEDNTKIYLGEMCHEDGRLGSCPMLHFAITCVEILGCTTRELVYL